MIVFAIAANEEGIKEVFLKRNYLHALSYTHKGK